MKNLVSIEWWAAAGIRAAKTAVQTGFAMAATQAAAGTLNAQLIAETALIAGVASLGTSLPVCRSWKSRTRAKTADNLPTLETAGLLLTAF